MKAPVSSPETSTPPDEGARRRLLQRGVWLSGVVVVWNVVEGIIAVAAGILASSVALISFGIDSGVEVGSAAVVLWRFRRELRGKMNEGVEELERRTARVTGGLLFLLAAYIAVDAGRRLLGFGAEAEPSMVGMVMTGLSLVVMPLLGWAKLRTATELNSPSFRADAFETITCAWLSAATLAGLALNAAFGWSWADPLAALVILPLVIREGIEGWKGESCCDD
jgi:cation diffusion facilitator family transporter